MPVHDLGCIDGVDVGEVEERGADAAEVGFVEAYFTVRGRVVPVTGGDVGDVFVPKVRLVVGGGMRGWKARI